jgi:signal transduction histidine kinase
VQEALTNVLRHAKATRAWITLTAADDCVWLRIRDDGVGVRPEAQLNKLSHGIHGMRQRITALGGEFRIQGSLGVGTTVDVVVPVPRQAAAVAPSVGVDVIVSSNR